MRAVAVVAAVLAIQAQPQPAGLKLPALLEGEDPIALTIEAPLKELFAKGTEDETVTVPATLRLDRGKQIHYLCWALPPRAGQQLRLPLVLTTEPGRSD